MSRIKMLPKFSVLIFSSIFIMTIFVHFISLDGKKDRPKLLFFNLYVCICIHKHSAF